MDEQQKAAGLQPSQSATVLAQPAPAHRQRRDGPKPTAPIAVHPALNEALLRVARVRMLAGQDVKKADVVDEFLSMALEQTQAARANKHAGAAVINAVIDAAQANPPNDELRDLLGSLDSLIVNHGNGWTRSIQVVSQMHERLEEERLLWRREQASATKQELTARLLLYGLIHNAHQPAQAATATPSGERRYSVQVLPATYQRIVDIVRTLRDQTGQAVTVRSVIDQLLQRGLEQIGDNYQLLRPETREPDT